MAISRFYYDVEVWRGTPTVGGTGRTTVGVRTKNSTIQGVVNQSQVNEVTEAGQWAVREVYKMLCEPASDVRSTDQIRVSLSPNPNINGVYRVIGDPKDTIARGHHLRIMLEKRGVDNNG